MKQIPPSPEAIAERAYRLWEQAGRPDGRDQEFWLGAEAEIANNQAALPAKSAGKITRHPPKST